MVVSPEHRRIFERQVAALRQEESDDEGTPEFRAMMVRSASEWRRAHGIAALKE